MECERQTYYDEEFFLEHGYVSCYECDETFTDISILELHQQKHLDLENSGVTKRLTWYVVCVLSRMVQGRGGSNPPPRAKSKCQKGIYLISKLTSCILINRDEIKPISVVYKAVDIPAAIVIKAL